MRNNNDEIKVLAKEVVKAMARKRYSLYDIKEVIISAFSNYNIEYIDYGVHGSCSWHIDFNGILTIFPTDGKAGILNNQCWENHCYAKRSPWYECRELITKVVIKEGVRANQYSSALFMGFENCFEMDVSKMDTSKTEVMWNMFDGCYSLSSLDISEWSLSNVKDMENMFAGCKLLRTLKVKKVEKSGIKNTAYMFYNCGDKKNQKQLESQMFK